MRGTSYRTELCISGAADSQVGRTAGPVPLSSRRYPQRGALITRRRGWPSRAAGDEHDIVQFLAAGQDGDQGPRRSYCTLGSTSPWAPPGGAPSSETSMMTPVARCMRPPSGQSPPGSV